MNEELRKKVNTHLGKLRAADTQPTAVAWMTEACKLLETCLEDDDKKEQTRIVFLPTPKLEVVQTVPDFILHRRPRVWFEGQTVVYPELPMPIEKPKAWTRRDTLRLEAASKFSPRQIARKGK